MTAPAYAPQSQRLLETLCAQHRIQYVPRLEWSSRMRTTLGRAFADRNLIRLSAWLSHEQADDTLRHELAHIASAHGADGRRRQRPHGQRWRQWAARLGAVARATAKRPPVLAPRHHAIGRYGGRHYWGLECPGCGVRLVRLRVLPGLYHRPCGPRRGTLAKVFQAPRDQVLTWVRQEASQGLLL